MQSPGFHFDKDLRDVPDNKVEWESYLSSLKEQLKSAPNDAEKLPLYEMMGFACRILMNLDHAEIYFLKALDLSYHGPGKARILQNLIRLAHVYQWQKEFKKSEVLFDQAKIMVHDPAVSESLKASYHQHLGKFFFDQKFFGLAYAEFALALHLRKRIKADSDLIESSTIAITEALKRWNYVLDSGLVLRRAEISDALGIHRAHMSSIQDICAKDYTDQEVQVWGHRPYREDVRHSSIKDDDIWVIDLNGNIEGYVHQKVRFNENGKISYVFGLYLTSQILGKSLGKRAMGLIEETVKWREAKEIRLESTLTAKDFYKAMGFQENGPESTIVMSGVGIRCIPMRKEIK